MSSWGSLRTGINSNSLDEHQQRDRESNKAKTNKASEEQAKWQAVHPFEVLRGREGPKDVAANHSHFQWGESVTRSPAHPVRHK